MEFALLAAIVAAVLYAARPRSSSSGSTSPSPPGGSAPPGPSSPPAPAGALPPGVYPAGTAGAIPVVLYVQGGDNDARIYATPGTYAGPLPPKTVTLWYGPGTRVTFRAAVDAGPLPFSLTAFDHFEGPGGVSTRQNPFAMEIRQTGYVRAVFAWLGQVGG